MHAFQYANYNTVGAVLGVIMVLWLILYVYIQFTHKEGFASAKAVEVQKHAMKVFNDTGGRATYAQYKAAVPHADPVQFTDTRGLWSAGQLTPERVEAAEHA
jgi:hypothetical protein